MTDWMDAAAAQVVMNHDPIIARLSKFLLRNGQTPQAVMQRLKKECADSTLLGLLEMALDYWKGEL